MKKIKRAFLLVILISSSAFASEVKRGPNSKSDPMKTLSCTLEYKEMGALQFVKVSEGSGNYILGEKSSASLNDILKLSEVSFEAVEKNKKDFFRVVVKQNRKELVNAVFEWRGMQVTLPIHIVGRESEDPPTYDQMRITCDTSHTAG